MFSNTEKKDKELKIRLTQAEKKGIQSMADKATGGNLSNYVLQKCLYEAKESSIFLSSQVGTWNYVNELHRLIDDLGTTQMKEHARMLQRNYQDSLKGEEDEPKQ